MTSTGAQDRDRADHLAQNARLAESLTTRFGRILDDIECARKLVRDLNAVSICVDGDLSGADASDAAAGLAAAAHSIRTVARIVAGLSREITDLQAGRDG